MLVWYQHSESFSNEIFWSALDNGQPIPGATIATRAPWTDPKAIYRNQYLPRVPVSAFFHLLIAGLMEPVEERVCRQKTLFLICQLPQQSHLSKIFYRWTIMLTSWPIDIVSLYQLNVIKVNGFLLDCVIVLPY